MRRTAKRMAIAGLVTAAAVTIPATAANADNGDGNLACNNGEICLTYDQTYSSQKHFWYSGGHAGYKFSGNGQNVQNNVWGVWNRDTQCDVKVVDDRGFYPDDVFTAPRGSGWLQLSSSVKNQNDRHERAGYSGCA